jgi:hypothetical protein
MRYAAWAITAKMSNLMTSRNMRALLLVAGSGERPGTP